MAAEIAKAPVQPKLSLATPKIEIGPGDIVIYSHSPILYWWPIWVAGFLMALLTYWDGGAMAYLPPGTEMVGNTLVVPEGTPLERPHERMAQDPYLGTWFFIIVLLVFLLSNVQLRGLWEWITLLSIGLGVTLLSWLGWWTKVFDLFNLLHIHINLAGYLFIAMWVLTVWVLSVFFFDRRTYVVFSSGQVRIRDEIGEAEKTYDVTNLTFQVRPNVLFRHRILGFYGAGDLVIRTGGPNPEIIEWPNVLFARSRLKEIQERLKAREVV